MKLVTTALAITLAGLTAAAPVAVRAQQVTGAGATFPAPVYAKWGEAAKAAIGIELNYQAIGSGGGQNQIINRTVDFGASDAPVEAPHLEQNKLLQFPTVMGAVVPIVNIPGVESNKLKLTGELMAEIYLGQITKWNDPKLVELNQGVTLPNLAIAPVYRADGSGTTFVFTSYLSTVSPAWKGKVGASTSVKWAAGNGAKGNDGVAATVRQVRGSIGYVENAYATQNKLVTTQLRNHDGQFVAPTLAAFTAAAENGDWKNAPNYAINLIDAKGATSWPIVSATFILLPKDPKDPVRSANVTRFFDWAYTNGGPIASGLEYIPLPKAVQDSVRASWKAEIKG
ncbi:phosphate ABC transporter substrate-binding protein PstS [Limobrevibacterium gyesilva]|uniref:Phosphate-binding protein PstS n=1 Tax=Limobrevibacterium gyesilva TaxID=2991712 RepID=A0AA41YLM2_9PROT|nr:phosphate ABC transporter substrate-binding protein PstS [Limobrevibacterium gyesilva]MCW3476106.1 phosphate ABC transporter substrate-binding protein PstS [Limobrevibacterium gyesilva]